MSRLRKLRSALVRRLAAVLLATVLVVSLTSGFYDCGSSAHASDCATACKQSYGECYKSSQNRAHCDAMLQRCLMGCR